MDDLEAVRTSVVELCTSLPEVDAEEQGRDVGFSVRGRSFAWYLEDHQGDGKVALACKAGEGVADTLIASDPGRLFSPAHLGAKGWVGVRLDAGAPDWDELARLVSDAHLLVAPASLR